MTTCRDAIRAAYRKLGVVRSGQEPSASQAEDGLRELQAVYDGSVFRGLFGRLTDVLVSADYEAGEGERVANSSDDDIDITLPETVLDADTGLARKPKDLSPVVIEGGESYLYEAGAWNQITNLALGDDAPLSGRLYQWLVGELVVRLADDMGLPVPQTVVADVTQGRSALSYKASTYRDPPTHF